MINEVDADTPGSDTAEFVELYDGGIGNTPLDGLVVVFFEGVSGSGNQSYAAFDLDGYSTDANGYFVMGNPGVPGASLMFDPGEFGLLSNGPDAVGLYIGNGSDFPTGTNATTTNLQDAIVYGTDDPNASGLLPLLNAGQTIVNENATGNSQTQSSQRCPNGMGGFRNTSPYYPGAPTPGTANTCPATRPPSDVVISQIYGGGGNSGATYHNDYVELYNRGAGPVDLTGWSLQYASSTGSGWDSNKQPLGGAIGAGEYLPDCAGVGRRERREPAAGEHYRSDQHGGGQRKDCARQQLHRAGGQLSDLRPEHQGPRRLRQRRLRRRLDHDVGGQQYDGALPQEQRQPRYRQQRERLRRAGAAESAPHGPHRRARPERADHRPALERHQRAARCHHPGDLHGASRRGRWLVHADVREQRSAQQRHVRRRLRRQGSLHHAERQLHRRRAVHGHDPEGPDTRPGSGRQRSQHRHAAG